MSKIVTVDQMKQLETEADARGVSYAQMMDYAGAAVADSILRRIQRPEGFHPLRFATGRLAKPFGSDTAALILVGPGNNGGDGLVAARHLHDGGCRVKIFSLKTLDESDSKVIALRERSLFITQDENDLETLAQESNVIVDALFGTGMKLPLRENVKELLTTVNRHRVSRRHSVSCVAVDCPSGMDCDSGEIDSAALPADLTVTFGAAKVGQFKFPAANYLGELIIAPIGWDDDLPTLKTITLELADAERAQKALPARPRDAHKYTFGKMLAIVGSKNYVGAARLVGEAANRIGTGLVTLAVPQSIYPILASQMIETTWLPMPDEDGAFSETRFLGESGFVGRYDSVVIGCGLGTAETTKTFMRDFVGALHATSVGALHATPLLVDADGLRLLATITDWHKKIPPMSVLTPHSGEMGAMTGLSTGEIKEDRVDIAQRFAKEWGHVVLLKGAF
ncbi:MAG: NAD(P)H-hydrate epimerase, partial [Chloroflexi bacterium]|nr:NAD(P)H-hydrate epimerase [Chloroflexota bacterium]